VQNIPGGMGVPVFLKGCQISSEKLHGGARFPVTQVLCIVTTYCMLGFLTPCKGYPRPLQRAGYPAGSQLTNILEHGFGPTIVLPHSS